MLGMTFVRKLNFAKHPIEQGTKPLSKTFPNRSNDSGQRNNNLGAVAFDL